jgi:broad specificity phosphatase PhoE
MIGKGSYNERENVAYVDEVLSRDNPLSNNDFKGMLQLKTLPSLGEVDFGSIEGKSVNDAKAEMMTTWAKWSLGKIDATDGNDGESGRNVFQRVSLALNSLTEIAASTGGSVIAVTHSAYLRIFLSLALELPLVEAATLEQKNCCVNVLDLSLTETVTIDAKAKVFGGRLSMAPNDFILEFPKTKVIVMNEIRHLTELV